ncbi:MAG: transposase [Pseudomonadota bacterium]
MARYQTIDTSPRLLPVDLSRQLLPGTFEHALNHLLDHELDLSGLEARYGNDETGAPAYPPAVLLKLILFAYSRGIVSSRGIEEACRSHVIRSGTSAPARANRRCSAPGISTTTRRRRCASARPGGSSTQTPAAA